MENTNENNLAVDSKNSTNEKVNIIKAADIVASFQISTSELPKAANDNEPQIPEDPNTLALFVKQVQTKKGEFNIELSPKSFQQKENAGKEHAVDWLRAQLAMGQYLCAFPTKQGYKHKKISALKKQGVIFRDDAAKEYNLDGQKLRYILELDLR